MAGTAASSTQPKAMKRPAILRKCRPAAAGTTRHAGVAVKRELKASKVCTEATPRQRGSAKAAPSAVVAGVRDVKRRVTSKSSRPDVGQKACKAKPNCPHLPKDRSRIFAPTCQADQEFALALTAAGKRSRLVGQQLEIFGFVGTRARNKDGEDTARAGNPQWRLVVVLEAQPGGFVLCRRIRTAIELTRHRWKMVETFVVTPCECEPARKVTLRLHVAGPEAEVDYAATERSFIAIRKAELQNGEDSRSWRPPPEELRLHATLRAEEAKLLAPDDARKRNSSAKLEEEARRNEAALRKEYASKVAEAEMALNAARDSYESQAKAPAKLESAEGDEGERPVVGPIHMDPNLCLARTWNGGAGGQCHRRPVLESAFCSMHGLERSRAHGQVDGPVPAAKLTEFQQALAPVQYHTRESFRRSSRHLDKQLSQLKNKLLKPAQQALASLKSELHQRIHEVWRPVDDAQKLAKDIQAAELKRVKARAAQLEQSWVEAAQQERDRHHREQMQFEREVNAVRMATCSLRMANFKQVFMKRRVLCNNCSEVLGLPSQEMRCDACFAALQRERRIEQMNLRPYWCKDSQFTARSVFMHERVLALRAERRFSDLVVVRDMAKREWAAMGSHARAPWEDKRQHIVNEMYENLAEVEEDSTRNSGSIEDCQQLGAKLAIEDWNGQAETMSSGSDVRRCWRCLRTGEALLKCANRGCEHGELKLLACRVALHPACCEPALTAAPEGAWFCSAFCREVDAASQRSQKKGSSERPVGANGLVAGVRGDSGSTASAHRASLRRAKFLLKHWSAVSPLLDDCERRRTALEALVPNDSGEPPTIEDCGDALGDLEAALPDGLRTYQKEGVRWLVRQHHSAGSAILGDEMGLGKTLQVLSLLKVLVARSDQALFLVVCPLSVMTTWRDEARKWTPRIIFAELHGSLHERARQKERFNTLRGEGPVLLVTSYEVLLTEIQWLRRLQFQYIILDEAHRIKNNRTLTGQAVRAVKAENRLLLTGTPLQNNLGELWSLLNFLFPEAFDGSTHGVFASAFSASSDVRDDRVLGYCHALMQPLMLRRLKADVLTDLLPPKSELIINVPLSPVQRWHYRDLLRSAQNCASGFGAASEDASIKRNINHLLMQLWKCCNHPYLFEGVRRDSDEASPQERKQDADALVFSSGKFCVLDHLLRKLLVEATEPRKVLIFSQFTKTLDLIEDFVASRGFQCLRLDGSTSIARRRYYMYLFNRQEDGPKVFLVSTKAGGLGLNLQAASVVVLFDSAWNPWSDLQAMDRAHRVGQSSEVTVYRLICTNTCEERIRFFAEQKLQLKDLVLRDTDTPSTLEGTAVFSDEQKFDMVRFGAEAILQGDDEEANDGLAAGRAFYEDVGTSLAGQLASLSAAKGVREAVPIRRALGKVDSTSEAAQNNGRKRAGTKDTRDDPSQVEAAKRRRVSTTVTVDTKIKGLGKMQVSRTSLFEAQHLRELEEGARAKRETREFSKKVLEHEVDCAHCRRSLHAQRVVVSRSTNGFEEDRWTLESSREGRSAVRPCSLCPRAFHTRCLDLYNLGDGAPIRCPQHRCYTCGRGASDVGGLLFRCVDCPKALCYDCLERFDLLGRFEHLRGSTAFEAKGFAPPANYEYMRCPTCCVAPWSGAPHGAA